MYAVQQRRHSDQHRKQQQPQRRAHWGRRFQ
jgi:hypothetical protein